MTFQFRPELVELITFLKKSQPWNAVRSKRNVYFKKQQTRVLELFLSGPTTTTEIRPDGGAILALFIY